MQPRQQRQENRERQLDVTSIRHPVSNVPADRAIRALMIESHLVGGPPGARRAVVALWTEHHRRLPASLDTTRLIEDLAEALARG